VKESSEKYLLKITLKSQFFSTAYPKSSGNRFNLNAVLS